jgi:hypothetical protein
MREGERREGGGGRRWAGDSLCWLKAVENWTFRKKTKKMQGYSHACRNP